MKPNRAASGVEFVGIDDGYADTKLFGSKGGFVIPSRGHAMALLDGVLPSVAKESSCGVYAVHDGFIQIDPTIDGDDTCYDGYHTSSLNAAIIHQALIMGNYGGRSVDLAVGLPFGSYFTPEGVVNEALIAQKIANLRRPISRVDGKELAKIERVNVYAQTVSAYLNQVIDASGGVQMMTGPIGVVDVGGRTTDLIVVLPPKSFDFQRSVSLNIGLMNVHQMLADYLRSELSIDFAPSQVIHLAVKNGRYAHGEKLFDVSSKVAEFKDIVSSSIVAKIKQFWGDGSGLEKVLFVGGGCDALPSIYEAWGGGEIVASPTYANAKGMRKYMRFVDFDRSD